MRKVFAIIYCGCFVFASLNFVAASGAAGAPVAKQARQEESQQQFEPLTVKAPDSSDESGEPKAEPYSFSYNAQSQGGLSMHEESGDGTGRVQGFYMTMGDDGRMRRVDYIADADGFRPQVKTNEMGTRTSSPGDAQYAAETPSSQQLNQAKITLEEYEQLEKNYESARTEALQKQATPVNEIIQNIANSNSIYASTTTSSNNNGYSMTSSSYSGVDDDANSWRKKAKLINAVNNNYNPEQQAQPQAPQQGPFQFSAAARVRESSVTKVQPTTASTTGFPILVSSAGKLSEDLQQQQDNQQGVNADQQRQQDIQANQEQQQREQEQETINQQQKQKREQEFIKQQRQRDQHQQQDVNQSKTRFNSNTGWRAQASGRPTTSILQNQLMQQFMQQANYLTKQDYPRQDSTTTTTTTEAPVTSTSSAFNNQQQEMPGSNKRQHQFVSSNEQLVNQEQFKIESGNDNENASFMEEKQQAQQQKSFQMPTQAPDSKGFKQTTFEPEQEVKIERNEDSGVPPVVQFEVERQPSTVAPAVPTTSQTIWTQTPSSTTTTTTTTVRPISSSSTTSSPTSTTSTTTTTTPAPQLEMTNAPVIFAPATTTKSEATQTIANNNFRFQFASSRTQRPDSNELNTKTSGPKRVQQQQAQTQVSEETNQATRQPFRTGPAQPQSVSSAISRIELNQQYQQPQQQQPAITNIKPQQQTIANDANYEIKQQQQQQQAAMSITNNNKNNNNQERQTVGTQTNWMQAQIGKTSSRNKLARGNYQNNNGNFFRSFSKSDQENLGATNSGASSASNVASAQASQISESKMMKRQSSLLDSDGVTTFGQRLSG